ncbi:protein ANTAGONIST OF LIKE HETEROCHROMATIN PROTEIN 1 [Folsomia candida]|uniref:Putative nuclease HARBI1 n=1 Tax=Folsomia candida TaxID=158441 RepID=A0A226DNJ9_FOLCA|nr:protein ANTAGONIST OF LIKE HETEROCHROMATIN PROTEIN 1 [Folsomia candida]OXA46779.1 putative nuclease HARBI1 [Folsomia candida]
MSQKSAKTHLIEALACNAILAMETEEEEIDDIIENFENDLSAVLCIRYATSRTIKTPKSKEWIFSVLPNYAEREFKENLRVSRTDFGRILNIISPYEGFSNIEPGKQFPIAIQLAVALFRFGVNGTGASYSKLAQKFGIGNGTVDAITKRVIKAIVSVEKEWIYWPDETEREKLAELCPQLPGCIGIVDGSHINLEEAPINDPQSYFSRKMRYSIHLQGICDAELRLRHILVGYPGSVHDARVFANCDIAKHPENYFNLGQWIAGDSAYKLQPYLITTLRTNAVIGTQKERDKFNKVFCNFRVKIEQVYGGLKEIFTSLKELRMQINFQDGHQYAVQWITACCVLYNIILESLDEYPVTDEMLGDENDQVNPRNGNLRPSAIEKRDEIFNYVQSR